MEYYRHLHGLLCALAVTALLAGCASTGAPMPPTLDLPKPPTDLTATRKGDRVYLTWTQPTQTTDRQSIRHPGPTRICRTLGAVLEQCGTEIGDAPPEKVPTFPTGKNVAGIAKISVRYTDTLSATMEQQHPTSQLVYAVEASNTAGRSAGLSNRVEVPAAPTLVPPSDFEARVTAAGVALSWSGIAEQNEAPEIGHRYRIYRRDEASQNPTPLADLPLTGLNPVSFVDHSFEWEKKYEYWLTVVTIVRQPGQRDLQVEGNDTSIIHVATHDVFPPAVPAGLQAVFSGAGQQPFVDLIWAPATDADLDGYNVYRSEGGNRPVKLNAAVVKAPAYRDSGVTSGTKYVYSVSAVDVRGNESGRSDEAEEDVP
jgi:hypothetical protein